MPGKILLVDDAAFMRMMLKKILASTGNELIEAVDGSDGVAKYKEHKPNLVLLDIIMPNTDGIECLKQIIAFDKGAKVVMCSSIGQQTVVNDAIKIGARDFIIKPFDAAKVMDIVSKNL
ncbi:MAG: response regulator [Candidatus Methanoperedens sp.]|nr:response regulator [Candidatus Methanoperedens sp.]VVB94843.1 Chemotaxis protein CheY [uncultured archaeon]